MKSFHPAVEMKDSLYMYLWRGSSPALIKTIVCIYKFINKFTTRYKNQYKSCLTDIQISFVHFLTRSLGIAIFPF